MNRGVLVGGALAVAVLGGAAGYRVMRGDVGAVSANAPLPEFSALEAARWANGAPTSLASARGNVVFVEGWSPG